MASRQTTTQRYLLNIVALYKQRQDVRSYLELLLSIAAIAVFVAFAIKPTLVTIGDLITKINVEQQTSDELDTKIKNLGIAQNVFNDKEDQINLLDQAVPTGPDVAGYVRQVEGLSNKENLKIISLSVDQTKLVAASPSASVLSTTISVSGEYTGLQSFIKDLEGLRRPGFIVKMDFTETLGTLNLTITPETPFIQ